MGPSGSGKSTIAKLLVRFYDPDAGGIQINGIDIRNVPLDDLMSNISFVTQDNFLFDTSIKENIRMGNITATDEDVVNAANRPDAMSLSLRFRKAMKLPPEMLE